MLQVRGDFVIGFDAAVDDDFQRGKLAFQAVDIIVAQRRHVAVFLGREAFQPSIAGVDDEGCAIGFFRQCADKIGQRLIIGFAVKADSVLDGNGTVGCGFLHRVQAVGHQIRLLHQARAERAFLNARAGTAAVEVDFVVAVSGGFGGRFGQILRLAAAQLQRDGVFAVVFQQEAVGVAVNHRARVNHFGVKPGMAGDLACHMAIVPISPVQHGGYG